MESFKEQEGIGHANAGGGRVGERAVGVPKGAARVSDLKRAAVSCPWAVSGMGSWCGGGQVGMKLLRKMSKPLKMVWTERIRQVLMLFCKINGSEFEKKKKKKTQISIKMPLEQKITGRYVTTLNCLHISIIHLGNLK